MATESEPNVENKSDSKLSETTDTTSAEMGNEIITKHPLQNQWQLWYFRPEKGKDWMDNLLDVTNFDTVEDFWGLYNHIELASNLSSGSDYSIFKMGIKPMWEDDRNKMGGRWLFTFNKKAIAPRQIDEMWLEVLLCLIGEAFGDHSDQVCGAVINIRPKMDKISIWTGDCKNAAAITHIGKTLKQRTRYPGMISYEAHVDTQSKTGSSVRHLHSM